MESLKGMQATKFEMEDTSELERIPKGNSTRFSALKQSVDDMSDQSNQVLKSRLRTANIKRQLKKAD